jgi:hypothetical protein
LTGDNYTAATVAESSDLQESDKNVYYGLTGCICSMLSLIIGCGIISMPYSASIVDSIWVSILVNLVSIILMLIAAMIYLKVRDNIIELYFSQSGSKVTISISDISYLILGRSSILVFNGFIGFAIFGINVLFYLFFTQTTLSVFFVESQIESPNQLLLMKCMVISGLTIVLAPAVLKR